MVSVSDKILITGGAGFVGFHLAKNLAKTSTVHLCDNLFRGRMDEELRALLENKNVGFIKCDMTNVDDLKALDNNYNYVYHLAAVQGTRNFYEMPDKVLRTNMLSAINILDWFSSSQSGKILFSSSSETYSGTIKMFSGQVPTPEDIPLCVDDIKNPRWSYGVSKIAGELLFINYAKTRKFRMSIIRYHNVYGPRMGFDHVVPEFFVRAIKKEDPFKIYGGKETRAFCYVDDAVAATELVMKAAKDGDIVHIGTQDEIAIMELAKKVCDVANLHPHFEVLPSPEGSVSRRCPDITKLRSLGFEPAVSLNDGLKKTYEWYKKYRQLYDG